MGGLFIPHRDQHNPDYLQQLREDEHRTTYTLDHSYNDSTIVFVPGENDLTQQENGYITKCLLEKPEDYVHHIGNKWGTNYGNRDTNWANTIELFNRDSTYQICYEPNVEDCPSIDDQRNDRKALHIEMGFPMFENGEYIFKCYGEDRYLCCDGDNVKDLTCDPCSECCEYKDAVEYKDGKVRPLHICPTHCNCDDEDDDDDDDEDDEDDDDDDDEDDDDDDDEDDDDDDDEDDDDEDDDDEEEEEEDDDDDDEDDDSIIDEEYALDEEDA